MTATVRETLTHTGAELTRDVTLPTCWNDCDLKQLFVLYAVCMGRDNVNVKRIRIVTFLLGLSAADLTAMEQACTDDYGEEDGEFVYLEQIEMLCRSVADPFFHIEEKPDGSRVYSIALTRTRCPYPHIEYADKKHRKQRLYAASDGLRNADIYELAQVFTLCEAIMRGHNDALLHRLLATVWRMPKDRSPENLKSGYRGDIRRPLQYEEGMADRRAKHFEQVPDDIKQVMLFWLLSCRASIVADWPVIFTAEKKAPQEGEKEYGWAGLLLQLANGPNVDAISATRWETVFVYLAMLEDQRQMRELERAR